MWGGGGFGFGNAGFANAIGYQNLATQNDVQRGFDNQNSMANQREILTAVTGDPLPITTTIITHSFTSRTGDPLPITTTINGVAGVPIKNALGQPLLSNVVPYGKTYGRFVMGGDTTTAADSYVILKTPCYA